MADSRGAFDPTEVTNPYGGGPGTGITLPDYYTPATYYKNNNIFYPSAEILPTHEMRVTFLGSTPWPATTRQKGTSIYLRIR